MRSMPLEERWGDRPATAALSFLWDADFEGHTFLSLGYSNYRYIRLLMCSHCSLIIDFLSSLFCIFTVLLCECVLLIHFQVLYPEISNQT